MGSNFLLTRPVFFIGFMGAGKTSVSRKLARTYRLSAVDADTYLERREGKKIKAIFAEVGEEGFREIESDVLAELAQKDPLLISCGGGVVERAENRALLHESGFVVHLRVSADEAAERISNLSTRPLFDDIEAARALYERRAALYDEVADVTINTAEKGVNRVAREVKKIIMREGVLCRLQK